MKLDAKRIKRLLIFFLYDKDGIVDRYVTYMLNDIKKNVSEIFVVVNGKLSYNGRLDLEKITPNILVRENKGFDVWAYKAGLEHYGWDKLEQYEEVIMMNFTIMGPLYPFSEMFNEMDSRDVDFWGLTLYHKVDHDGFGKIEYGYIPLHIQSHFIAVRKRMLKSIDYQNYWETRPMINSYEEAVCFHEAIFTKKFEDYGYKWDVYIDTRDSIKYTEYPLFLNPLEMIKDRRCPVIKRRSFFGNYDYLLNNCTGEVSIQAIDYIKNNLDYDTDMIWENIIRCQNQLDINRNMASNYILPASTFLEPNKAAKHKCKIALIFHIYFDDQIDYCSRYVKSMPDDADIIFTTDTYEKKEKIISFFQDVGYENIIVIITENRGRDVSALLVAAKKIVSNYDYVCFAHDKKSSSNLLHHDIVGKSFGYKCFENVLASRCFVENVVTTFENNPRLGLLSPPAPFHSNYYVTVGQIDWYTNFENIKKLVEKLGLNVDVEQYKASVAPLGTVFWFRTSALKKLFDYGWNYKDFPEEPIQTDGTMLHAIERVYSLAVQDAGYYPARLYSDSYASIEVSNLHYYLHELTKIAFIIFGIRSHHDLVQFMWKSHEENLLSKVNMEAVLKEQTLKEQALKEQALREQALKEQALKEQALREQALKEQALKEQALKEQYDLFINSTSWKITKPFRELKKLISGNH